MSETEMECIRELQGAFHDLDKRILKLEGMDYCRCGRRKAVDKIFCDKCLDKLYNEITKDNFK